MAELFGFSITRKGAQDSGDTFTVPTPDAVSYTHLTLPTTPYV